MQKWGDSGPGAGSAYGDIGLPLEGFADVGVSSQGETRGEENDQAPVLGPEALELWDLLVYRFGVPEFHWREEIQPIPLGRPRVTVLKTGRPLVYDRPRDKEFQSTLRLHWLAHKPRIRPLEGPLVVLMRFSGWLPRQQPDLSNLVKAVEDAGNPSKKGPWSGLWKDDSQIKKLTAELVEWGKGVDPLVELMIWQLA